LERKHAELEKLDWSKVSEDLNAADRVGAPRREELTKVKRDLAQQRRYIRGEVAGLEVGASSVSFVLLVDPDEIQINPNQPDKVLHFDRLAINEAPIEDVTIRFGTAPAEAGSSTLRLALAVAGNIDPKMAVPLRASSLISVRGVLDEFRRLDAYGSR
jgi:hypothetical protein